MEDFSLVGDRLGISSRQREVARLAMAGYDRAEMAAHLGVSSNTLDMHFRRLYRRLGVCTRWQLTLRLAIELMLGRCRRCNGNAVPSRG